MGGKFTFLSSCEHHFCTECLTDLATTQIDANKVHLIHCADKDCKVPLNDLDMRNLGLSKQMREKYDNLMLKNAIEQMDDMCWCPLPTCGSIAVKDKQDNSGKCQHCEFHFCLDCKEQVHPFKRCMVNRIDLLVEYKQEINDISEGNKKVEDRLNEIYFKQCTKWCPNPKCGVRIAKIQSGCTHVQCTQCFQYFCWACLNPAKG